MTTREAWGHGIATTTDDGTTLDTWYPSPALGAAPEVDQVPEELTALAGRDEARAVTIEVVTTAIDLDAPPADARDAYLRLHLLSHRLVTPNSINLDGLFGTLSNVVWTSVGRRKRVVVSVVVAVSGAIGIASRHSAKPVSP